MPIKLLYNEKSGFTHYRLAISNNLVMFFFILYINYNKHSVTSFSLSRDILVDAFIVCSLNFLFSVRLSNALVSLRSLWLTFAMSTVRFAPLISLRHLID